MANGKTGKSIGILSQKTHLIIHCNHFKVTDAATFRSAALILQNEYSHAYPSDKIENKFAKTGKEIVNIINSHMNNSIVSLDILSHGNPGGIHISQKLINYVEAGYIQRKAHYHLRKNSDHPVSENQSKYIQESIHGLYSNFISLKAVSYYYNQTYEIKEEDGVQVENTDWEYINKINFKKFNPNCFVEFHGCLIGKDLGIKDNFAENFSENLEKDAIVVAHIEKANPNKNDSSKSDYRHGPIAIFQDGKIKSYDVAREKMKFENSSTPL